MIFPVTCSNDPTAAAVKRFHELAHEADIVRLTAHVRVSEDLYRVWELEEVIRVGAVTGICVPIPSDIDLVWAGNDTEVVNDASRRAYDLAEQ